MMIARFIDFILQPLSSLIKVLTRKKAEEITGCYDNIINTKLGRNMLKWCSLILDTKLCIA